MVVIDDMNPVPAIPTARPRMLGDEGGTQKRFDAIVIDMHPQTPPWKNGGQSAVTAHCRIRS